MLYVILWLLFCLLPGALALERGRSFVGFFLLGVVLTPFISVIIVLCMEDLSKKEESREVRRNTAQGAAEAEAEVLVVCPSCGKDLPSGARFCPKCGYEMPEPEPEPEKAAAEARGDFEYVFCSKCGAKSRTGCIYCPNCGHELEK